MLVLGREQLVLPGLALLYVSASGNLRTHLEVTICNITPVIKFPSSGFENLYCDCLGFVVIVAYLSVLLFVSLFQVFFLLNM